MLKTLFGRLEEGATLTYVRKNKGCETINVFYEEENDLFVFHFYGNNSGAMQAFRCESRSALVFEMLRIAGLHLWTIEGSKTNA